MEISSQTKITDSCDKHPFSFGISSYSSTKLIQRLKENKSKLDEENLFEQSSLTISSPFDPKEKLANKSKKLKLNIPKKKKEIKAEDKHHTNWGFLQKSNKKFFDKKIVISPHLKKINLNYHGLPPAGKVLAKKQSQRDLAIANKLVSNGNNIFSYNLKRNSKIGSQTKIQFIMTNNASTGGLPCVENHTNYAKKNSNKKDLDEVTTLEINKANTQLERLSTIITNTTKEASILDIPFNETKYVFNDVSNKKSKGSMYSNLFTNRLISEKRKMTELQNLSNMNATVLTQNNKSVLNGIRFNSMSLNTNYLHTIDYSKKKNKSISMMNNETKNNYGHNLSSSHMHLDNKMIKKKSTSKAGIATHISDSSNKKLETINQYEGRISYKKSFDRDKATIQTSRAKSTSEYTGDSFITNLNEKPDTMYDKIVNLSCSAYEEDDSADKINLKNLKRVIRIRDIVKNKNDTEQLEKFSNPTEYKKEKDKMEYEFHKLLKNSYHPIFKKEFKNMTHFRFKSVSGLYFGVKC